MGEPRLSHQSLRVLAAFIQGLGEQLTGADLIKGLGLPSGTIYPILLRFERAGWLTSEWENKAPQFGKPRRRLYQITGAGQRVAQQALEQLEPSRKTLRPSWNEG